MKNFRVKVELLKQANTKKQIGKEGCITWSFINVEWPMYTFCQNYWVLIVKTLFMPFNTNNHIKLVVHHSNAYFKWKRSKMVCLKKQRSLWCNGGTVRLEWVPNKMSLASTLDRNNMKCMQHIFCLKVK